MLVISNIKRNKVNPICRLIMMSGLNALIVLLAISSPVLAQDFKVEIREVSASDRIMIVAQNHEPFPVTVDLTIFDLKNVDLENTEIAVALPPTSDQQTLNILHPKPGKSWNYKIKYQLHFGDILHESYDSNYIYRLPYESGASYIVSQGYNGTLSHQGENALDFDMPIGTRVCAARAGMVVKAVDEHNRSCPNISCNAFNNHILILHSDGTFSEYAHLKRGGALVDVGQEVQAGQVIALSGNTGWTTGPHLHFTVFKPNREHRKTLPTKFDTGDMSPRRLQELKTYTAQ